MTSHAKRIIAAERPLNTDTPRYNPSRVWGAKPAEDRRQRFARLKGTYAPPEEGGGYRPATRGVPKGYTNPAFASGGVPGMIKTLALLNQSKYLQEIRDHINEGRSMEDFDPQAYEAVGVILQIMRGTIRGRHLTSRLAAARSILEQFRGLPKRQVEVEVGSTYADLIASSIQGDDPSAMKHLMAPATRAIEAEVIDESAGDSSIEADHPPTGDHDELDNDIPDDGLELGDYV